MAIQSPYAQSESWPGQKTLDHLESLDLLWVLQSELVDVATKKGSLGFSAGTAATAMRGKITRMYCL